LAVRGDRVPSYVAGEFARPRGWQPDIRVPPVILWPASLPNAILTPAQQWETWAGGCHRHLRCPCVTSAGCGMRVSTDASQPPFRYGDSCGMACRGGEAQGRATFLLGKTRLAGSTKPPGWQGCYGLEGWQRWQSCLVPGSAPIAVGKRYRRAVPARYAGGDHGDGPFRAARRSDDVTRRSCRSGPPRSCWAGCS
jgi:hypothetical protein